MRRLAILLPALICTAWLAVTACQAGQGAARPRLRVATYNIRDFDATASPQRVANVRRVIEALDADILALVEIGNRAMLEQVLPRDEWTIVIDDQGDRLNPALAVRRPLAVRGLAAPYDADDDQFLFEEPHSEPFFLYGRNLLCVEVVTPAAPLVVLVHHAKARTGGRHLTDWQRCGAAAQIVWALQHELADRHVVLLGDFNDNPDDQSLNILETGDWGAEPGAQATGRTALLANLCEPLVAQDRISWGLRDLRLAGGRIETRVPGSRRQNEATRFTSGQPMPILFDQILVTAALAERVVPGSIKVFDDPVALAGDQTSQASDHLPVLADLALAN